MTKRYLCSVILCVLAGVLPVQAYEGNWKVYNTQTKLVSSLDVEHAKNIVGQDDRVEITGTAEGYQRAAVVLEKNGKLWCPGAMVGKNIVLTAAHCVYKKNFVTGLSVYAAGVATSDKEWEGLEKAVYAGIEKAGRVSAKALEILIPADYNQTDNCSTSYHANGCGKYDYAFIILDNKLDTPYMGLKVLSEPSSLMGKSVTVLGRGQDKASRTLWLAQGKIGKQENPIIYHNADTLPGNSGGPIMLTRDSSRIIGLNNFHRENDNLPYPNGGVLMNRHISRMLSHLRSLSAQ